MASTKTVAHDPQCRDNPQGKPMAVALAIELAPFADPHSCLPGQWSRGTVILTEESVGPHTYQTSMSWPAGASRALCMLCRTTHDEEF